MTVAQINDPTCQALVDDAIQAQALIEKNRLELAALLNGFAKAGRLWVRTDLNLSGRASGRQVMSVRPGWFNGAGYAGVYCYFRNADGKEGLRDHGMQINCLEIRP